MFREQGIQFCVLMTLEVCAILVSELGGHILHSPSAPETGRIGRSGTTIPLKQSEDFWLCAVHFCCLSWTTLPDRGFGLRKAKELVDVDG